MSEDKHIFENISRPCVMRKRFANDVPHADPSILESQQKNTWYFIEVEESSVNDLKMRKTMNNIPLSPLYNSSNIA